MYWPSEALCVFSVSSVLDCRGRILGHAVLKGRLVCFGLVGGQCLVNVLLYWVFCVLADSMYSMLKSMDLCMCVLLTVLSSWRSCWLRFEDSCSLASSAAIFSSFISKDDFRVDSSFVSRSLNLKNTLVSFVQLDLCVKSRL